MHFRAIALTLALVATGSSAADQSVREITGDRIATVLINERETKLEIAPNDIGEASINPDLVEELGLRPSGVMAHLIAGRQKIYAHTQMVLMDRGDGKTRKRRVRWYPITYTPRAEGRVGPAFFPEDIVVFQMADPVQGETAITVPMIDAGAAGVTSRATYAGKKVDVYFTFDSSETVLTAGAGLKLAETYGGKVAGEIRYAPQILRLTRPVRTMVFDEQPMLGELPLKNVVVRSSKSGSTAVPDRDADPSEIVVSGRSGLKPLYRLYVGLDSMAGCSSLTFDKKAKEIRLSCKL